MRFAHSTTWRGARLNTRRSPTGTSARCVRGEASDDASATRWWRRARRAAESDDDEEMVLIFGDDGLTADEVDDALDAEAMIAVDGVGKVAIPDFPFDGCSKVTFKIDSMPPAGSRFAMFDPSDTIWSMGRFSRVPRMRKNNTISADASFDGLKGVYGVVLDAEDNGRTWHLIC